MKLCSFLQAATMRFAVLCSLTFVVLGCGAPLQQAPPTPTPTSTPVPTPTPAPTPTPVPPTAVPQASTGSANTSNSASASTVQAAAVSTPQVSVPSKFNTFMDSRLGYSLAVPSGWTELDLRSSSFQTLASTAGMGAQLAPLNELLESEAGDSLGVIYITDLSAAIFGGLPTLLNVSVVDAPGATADQVMVVMTDMLEQNASALGDVTVRTMETAVINNVPGVSGAAVANLSQVGMNAELFARVVGLVANDKIYVLTLATQSSKSTKYEPIFEQIIGTFRPE